MRDLSADTALDRDTQYLVDKGMTSINAEQFSNVVDRFFSDGYDEDSARQQALKTIRKLINERNNNERIG